VAKRRTLGKVKMTSILRDITIALWTRPEIELVRTANFRSICFGIAALGIISSCGGSGGKRPAKLQASNTRIGDCADPASSGVVSKSPKNRTAPRDLNGDNVPERVVADTHLCRGENCFWNLFAEQNGCPRYLGTIEGGSLEVLLPADSSGFRDLRSWWDLPGGKRKLMQRYRFRDGGYQLSEVLICRHSDDTGVQCASEEKVKK